VLKVEFWGYSDDGDFTDPEIIPKSTRYFPLGLTGIEVDITEKGTRYRCSAVPFNERAFGEPNVIKKPIQMSGETVKSILEDLIKNVNEQVALSDKEGKSVSLGNKHNLYKIKFPSWNDSEGWKDSPDNEIAGKKLVEILKDNALYKMIDPATAEKPTAYKKQGTTQPTPDKQDKEPEAIKYTPGKTVVQFAENMSIHEAITSVIRDSEYSRDILRNVKKNIDNYGMIKYFMVKIEILNLDKCKDIKQLPKELINLKILDCSHTYITCIPSEYTKLEYLNCSYTRVKYIPKELNNLQYLNCIVSQIINIPDTFTKLKYLSLDFDDLYDIPLKLINLESILLNNNKIDEMYDKYYILYLNTKYNIILNKIKKNKKSLLNFLYILKNN
jgi:hypothetical protein